MCTDLSMYYFRSTPKNLNVYIFLNKSNPSRAERIQQLHHYYILGGKRHMVPVSERL